MQFKDGRLHVEVPMGRVAYAGRAVPHGELHYDADNGAWYQVILRPARPAQRTLIRRLTLVATAAAGLVVAGAIASGIYLAKRQPAAPGSAAASTPLPAPLPQPQSVPVAPFLAASAPAAVDVVAEPYRQSGPLPQIPADQSPAVLPAPVATLPQVATLQATRSGAMTPVAATAVKVADEKKESFVVLNKAPEKPAQLSQPAPTAAPAAAPAKAAAEPSKPVEALAVTKPSERGTAERNALRLVTIVDASTIVIPDPKTGVPKPAKVGTVLPDGSTLNKVDPKAGTAETDKGTLRLE